MKGIDARIRDARESDRPALIAMMAALQEVERALRPRYPPGEAIADDHLRYLEEAARTRAGRVLVAEADGRLVGFLVCIGCEQEAGDLHVGADARRFGLVTDLFVLPEARHRGIARRLLAETAEHFRSLGIASLRVTTLAQNREARALYAALGFMPYELTLERRLDTD